MTTKKDNVTYTIYNGWPITSSNAKASNTLINDYTHAGDVTGDFNSCIEKYKDDYDIITGYNAPGNKAICYGKKGKPNEYDYIFPYTSTTGWSKSKLDPIRSAKQNFKKEIEDYTWLSTCSNGANINNLCQPGNNEKLYSNPLGEVKKIVAGDNIRDSINKSITRKSQLDNSKKKINIAERQLIIWSVVLGITSLGFLALLKNIKK